MADLQFDNQANEFGRPPVSDPGVDFTGKLIRWGFVSSRKEAEYALIAIAVLCLVAAYFVYKSA